MKPRVRVCRLVFDSEIADGYGTQTQVVPTIVCMFQHMYVSVCGTFQFQVNVSDLREELLSFLTFFLFFFLFYCMEKVKTLSVANVGQKKSTHDLLFSSFKGVSLVEYHSAPDITVSRIVIKSFT